MPGVRADDANPFVDVAIPTGLEYAAALGHGATRDGRSIGVRPTPPLGERLVLTGTKGTATLEAGTLSLAFQDGRSERRGRSDRR